MTAPSSADLCALAAYYQTLRMTGNVTEALGIGDDLTVAVLDYLDPANTNQIIATQLRREIADREASLALVLARGVSDAVEVDADV